MQCRPGCGACCIALSISSAIPEHPQGKSAGVRCRHLDEDNLCELFGYEQRPAVCAEFQATSELCGESRQEALIELYRLEELTRN